MHPRFQQEPLQHFAAWLNIKSRPQTVRNRLYYVDRFLRWLDHVGADPWSIDIRHLAAWLTQVGTKPATRSNARGALRVFYQWAYLTDRCTADPTKHLPGIRVPHGVPRPVPPAVLDSALEASSTARDALMLLLGALAGLRIGEIAPLHTADVSPESLYISGKGGRSRRIPVHSALVPFFQACESGFLFPSERNPAGHYLPASIGARIRSLLGGQWTAHNLRHKFATDFYQACPDIITLQALLGHARVDTTLVYTRPPADHLDEVSQVPTPVGVAAVRGRVLP
ncbi:tyrosine-type recombinase/integrase [Nesterenkonia marinintestina]|uniref:tyrosine-type recombinase/integrase n=1 Tax=Nesterenkonia marinintestina TaxID=2979865 RepID=UPI0021BE03B1|nr:tyrosine-type recombinase/integrase [Nesterenkonia sp. GX14115]